MNKTIRWQQRFHNLENAFLFLEEGLGRESLDPLQEAGIIQSFEFTFELAWKTLKDFLESKGIALLYPRDVIKECFQTQIIHNGHIWMEMLDKRKLLAHTYNRNLSSKAVQLIREQYFPGLKQVYMELKRQCSD